MAYHGDFKYMILRIEQLVASSLSNGNLKPLVEFLTEDNFGPKCEEFIVGLTQNQSDFNPMTKERYFCRLSSTLSQLPVDSEDMQSALVCTSNNMTMAVAKSALALTEYLYEGENEIPPFYEESDFDEDSFYEVTPDEEEKAELVADFS